MARNYQKALSEFGAKDVEEDRIGINASRLNTEVVSALTARTYGIKTIINLTNVDYVYDKDQNIFPGAEPIKEMKLKVVIINGKNLERMEDFLSGRHFIRTTIN